jgi:hypothetical protein
MDVADNAAPCVPLRKLPGKMLVDRSGPDDEQVNVAWQTRSDGIDEPSEMREPVRLAGRLRRTAAPMSDARVVSDMARRPVMCRHV